jgi:uracil-DNA glycosylase
MKVDPGCDHFLASLIRRAPSSTVSNPYAGEWGEARLENLQRYLTAVAGLGASLALIGEAPGYRGCAVTGIPFTSRKLLGADVGRWGFFAGQGYDVREALGGPEAEATATLAWRAVCTTLAGPPLTWNAFPFHPHPPGRRDANRRLTAAELEEGAGYLRGFLACFPLMPVLAVGRQAGRALRLAGIEPVATLRHPSHGGGAAYAAGLRDAARVIAGT